MQKKREAAATAAAPDDDCGLTHFYAAAKLPSGGWKSDGSALSIIFDPGRLKIRPQLLIRH